MNYTEKRELIELLRVRAKDCGYEPNPDTMMLNKAADALEEALWRDIESAPKDGSFINVKGADGHNGPAYFDSTDGWAWEGETFYCSVCAPTHWKPLDTPE